MQSSEDRRIDIEAITLGLSELDLSQKGIQGDLNRLFHKQEDQATAKARKDILEWLSPIDHAAIQSDTLRRRESDTGKYLLDEFAHQEWLGKEGGTLYCSGIPGSGKTAMTSIVIDDLSTRFRTDSTIGLAFLYCSYQFSDTQSFEEILTSILKQLIQRQKPLSKSIRDFHESKDVCSDLLPALYAAAA